MEGKLSLNKSSQREACKQDGRRRLLACERESSPRLFPDLPDDIYFLIIARLCRVDYLSLKLVSRSWKAAIISPQLYSLRKELETKERWFYILVVLHDHEHLWYAVEPFRDVWHRLPPMPKNLLDTNEASSSLGMGNRKQRGRRDDTPDRGKFYSFSVEVVDACFYVFGSLFESSNMEAVWRYDPVLNSWSEVSSMSIDKIYRKRNDKPFVIYGPSTGLWSELAPSHSSVVYTHPHSSLLYTDPIFHLSSEVPIMPISIAQMYQHNIVRTLVGIFHFCGLVNYEGSPIFSPAA